MLYLLRTKFLRDLLIYLLVIIIVGSTMSMAAGYLADNYFGKTVSGLIGDYGEFDLLLTVNREVKSSALTQIRDILRVKLPGSSVKQGVTVAGKTNFFVQLNNKYRTREHFMAMNNYFANVTGLVGVTMMAEPRVTVRGIPRGLVDQLEKEMGSLAGVKFSYPASSTGIDLMINSSKDIDRVTAEVNKLLNKYQILEVRFPIDNGPVDAVSLGERLAVELKDKYDLRFTENLTTNEVGDQQYLINTMLEMKKFLLQYATIISVRLPEESDLHVRRDDYLIMPGPGRSGLKTGDKITPMDLKLQVISVNDQEIQALISEGNVTDIQSKEVYHYNSQDEVTAFLGNAELKSPREDLQYAANELAKILPDLDEIFADLYSMTGDALSAIEMYSDTMVQVQDVQQALEEGQNKVAELRDKLTEVDLQKIEDFVANLLTVVTSAEEVSSKMDWAREELLRIDNELGQFQGQVDVLKDQFGISETYSEQLDKASATASQLQEALRNNADGVLEKMKAYNPILKNVSSWREDLVKLQQMVVSGDLLSNDTTLVTEVFDRLLASSSSTMDYLKNIDKEKMNQQVSNFKESLERIEQSDVSAIIQQLKYVSETLPKLRDEEVTRNIKLIENYMSGQIIPGEQMQIMVPGEFNIKQSKSFVMEVVGQSTISVFDMDAGNVQPNVRGEFLRIISEVRETITALIAIVLVLLFLMLDFAGVMSVIKEVSKRKKQSLILKILNSELLIGVIFGSISLELIFRLTGGQLPYIDNYPGAILGAIMGLIIALLTEKINPVNKHEYLAGEALGFSFTEILREIVIPAGKPGILLLLNRRHLVFK